MWCTIINIAIMALWMVFLVFAPNFTYRLQSRFFPLPRETYDVIIYSFLAMFKIVFIVFVFVPYMALLILQ
jgi:hypothetical protein